MNFENIAEFKGDKGDRGEQGERGLQGNDGMCIVFLDLLLKLIRWLAKKNFEICIDVKDWMACLVMPDRKEKEARPEMQ